MSASLTSLGVFGSDEEVNGGSFLRYEQKNLTRIALASAPMSCANATKAIEPESNQLLLRTYRLIDEHTINRTDMNKHTLIRQQKVS